jgi:hypothetical protein
MGGTKKGSRCGSVKGDVGIEHSYVPASRGVELYILLNLHIKRK